MKQPNIWDKIRNALVGSKFKCRKCGNSVSVIKPDRYVYDTYNGIEKQKCYCYVCREFMYLPIRSYGRRRIKIREYPNEYKWRFR